MYPPAVLGYTAKVVLTTSLATSGRVILANPELRYFAPDVCPTQESPRTSTVTTTPGGMVGSDTAAVAIFTGPEQEMASGPFEIGGGAVPSPGAGAGAGAGAGVPTVPELVAVKVEVAVCAKAGPAASKRQPSSIGRTTGSLAEIALVMAWLRVSFSECGGKGVVRRNEGDALRGRDRRRERPQEGRPVVVDLPPHQHGVVLVHGVVAVLHEHPAEVAELHGDRDAPSRAKPIDILASPLRGRDGVRISVAVEDLALLEVDVDRVVPSAAAVLQDPRLAGAVSGRGRDAAIVRVEHLTVVRLDAPRSDDRRDFSAAARLRRNQRQAVAGEGGVGRAPPELEDARPRDGNGGEVRVRDQRVGHLAHVRRGRPAHDAELEELPDHRVVAVAPERIRDREVRVRLLPVRLLGQVHPVDLGSARVAGEVDDEVVAPRDANLVRLGQDHGERYDHVIDFSRYAVGAKVYWVNL